METLSVTVVGGTYYFLACDIRTEDEYLIKKKILDVNENAH